MGYAFISYSTRNQSLADAMRDLLKDCGIETWMAPGDIPAGSKYAQVISRAVKNCSCFILMLSEDAQNSVWVAKEVERAVNYRKPIIPIQLENVVLNDEFELYISTDQVVAIQKIDKETREIKQVLEAVRAYTNVTGETDINSAFSELREKYPDDVTLLDKFFKICLKQQESILISNCDFEKRADYIAFFKKHLGETILCIEMQKLLDEMVYLLSERKSLDDFYAKYQTSGLLIIDDFQFCFGKEVSQEAVYRILKYRSENNLSTIIFSHSEASDFSIYTTKCLSILLETYDIIENVPDESKTVDSVIEEIPASNAAIVDIEEKVEKKNTAETQEDKSNDVHKFDEVALTTEQQSKIHDYLCKYCGMPAQIKKNSDGYWAQCSNCDAASATADNIDTALDNCISNMKEEWADDELSGLAGKDASNNSGFVNDESEKSDYAIADSTQLKTTSEGSEDASKAKIMGHLESSYISAIVITKEKCIHPLDILMPDNTIKTFDFCDEFTISNQKKYIVVCQINDLNECMFFIFKSRNGNNVFISEGHDQRRVYRWFREKHANEYIFTDDKINIEESDDNSKEKIKGHLVSSYRRVIDFSKDDCVNPIDILMPDNTTKTFDFCDEFAVSNQKKYIVLRQMSDSNEYLFFIFRSRNGKNTLISEGQDQEKVYRWFREKYADAYTFTDDKAAMRNKRKKKHFAQDTALRLFATADDIPQILVLPDKYEYISSNAFAKLNPEGKEIRQIVISNSVEVIDDNAFAGLVVTEAVHIPKSVRKTGNNAFTLKKGAYIYCEGNSYVHFLTHDSEIIKDVPFKRNRSNTLDEALLELSGSKGITRITSDTLPFSTVKQEIKEFIIPDGICVIDNHALDNVKIKHRVVIPSSVTRIGDYAFDLLPKAYVECDANSYAYIYCKEKGISNSVDISRSYKSKGLCAHCGGRFSGLLKKKCILCGKEKDY